MTSLQPYGTRILARRHRMCSATGTLALEADVDVNEKFSSQRLWEATPRSVTTTVPVTNAVLSAREKQDPSNASAAPDLTGGNELSSSTDNATHASDLARRVATLYTNRSPQLDSPLLSKLPRELRDQIWRKIVLEDLEIPIHVGHYETVEGEHCMRLQLDHPLMDVCKQVRAEVLDVYYVENTFRITDDIFSTRAVRELHRLLYPWAASMTRLEVHHDIVISQGNTAGINFGLVVSREEGREGHIVVEPHSFNAHMSTLRVDENGRIDYTSTFKQMCYCRINSIANKREVVTVLDWLQAYVDLIVQSQFNGKYYMPYCWTCACNIII